MTMSDNISEIVPQDADIEEATAIVAAVSTHLEEQRSKDEGAPSWQGDRWQFAGRIEALFQRSLQVPAGAPTYAWTASSRTDRIN
jgi:hypothetical protein